MGEITSLKPFHATFQEAQPDFLFPPEILPVDTSKPLYTFKGVLTSFGPYFMFSFSKEWMCISICFLSHALDFLLYQASMSLLDCMILCLFVSFLSACSVGIRVHGKETEPIGAGGCVGQLKARHHDFFFYIFEFLSFVLFLTFSPATASIFDLCTKMSWLQNFFLNMNIELKI